MVLKGKGFAIKLMAHGQAKEDVDGSSKNIFKELQPIRGFGS